MFHVVVQSFSSVLLSQSIEVVREHTLLNLALPRLVRATVWRKTKVISAMFCIKEDDFPLADITSKSLIQ